MLTKIIYYDIDIYFILYNYMHHERGLYTYPAPTRCCLFLSHLLFYCAGILLNLEPEAWWWFLSSLKFLGRDVSSMSNFIAATSKYSFLACKSNLNPSLRSIVSMGSGFPFCFAVHWLCSVTVVACFAHLAEPQEEPGELISPTEHCVLAQRGSVSVRLTEEWNTVSQF